MKSALHALQDHDDAKVFQRARRLARLERALHALVPAELRAHTRVGGETDGVLRVLVDSPVWHTRLRYLTPQLLPELNRLARSRLQRIDCVTRPFPTAPGSFADGASKKGKGPLRPSTATARDLSAAADAIDDPGLSAALRRLAQSLVKQGG